MSDDASEQDKTIARVVLAGWQLVHQKHTSGAERYQVIGPDGTWYGSASTRYSAACRAELYIWEDKLEDLMPKGQR